MPPRSPEPLLKVTFNLFAKDVAEMERRYGRGWTEQVRNMVRKHLNRYKLPTLDEVSPWADELEEDHG